MLKHHFMRTVFYFFWLFLVLYVEVIAQPAKQRTSFAPQISIICINNKYGLCDSATGKIILQPQYDWISNCLFMKEGVSEGIPSFTKNNSDFICYAENGLVNHRIIYGTDPPYESMPVENYLFTCNGRALIGKNGKMGVIDQYGNVLKEPTENKFSDLFPYIYDYPNFSIPNDSIFKVCYQLYGYRDIETRKFGLLSNTGEILQPPQYDFIKLRDSQLPMITVPPFSINGFYFDRLIITSKNGLLGCIDTTGKTLLAPVFENIYRITTNQYPKPNPKWYNSNYVEDFIVAISPPNDTACLFDLEHNKAFYIGKGKNVNITKTANNLRLALIEGSNGFSIVLLDHKKTVALNAFDSLVVNKTAFDNTVKAFDSVYLQGTKYHFRFSPQDTANSKYLYNGWILLENDTMQIKIDSVGNKAVLKHWSFVDSIPKWSNNKVYKNQLINKAGWINTQNNCQQQAIYDNLQPICYGYWAATQGDTFIILNDCGEIAYSFPKTQIEQTEDAIYLKKKKKRETLLFYKPLKSLPSDIPKSICNCP